LPRAFTQYFLLRALQERVHASPVVEVRYRSGTELLALADALTRGIDLAHAQIWRRHAGGLEVWVNRDTRTSWPVRAGGVNYELPPNGWLAWSPVDGFRAYSALVAGNRVDVCLAAEYSFLDTRGDVARLIEGITADGAVLLQPASVPGRQDVIMVNSRSLKLEGNAYRLSERADVSLRHVDPLELEVAALDCESGKSVLVTFPALSPEWEAGPYEVTEWIDDAWHRTPAQVQQTKAGLQLGRVRCGARYRVRVVEP
jgi:hypothetical protein